MTSKPIPLPEDRQRFTRVERMRMLIRSDPRHLTRDGLIRVLREGPESIRPQRMSQLRRDVLLDIVQIGLSNVVHALVLAPLIRREYERLAATKGNRRARHPSCPE